MAELKDRELKAYFKKRGIKVTADDLRSFKEVSKRIITDTARRAQESSRASLMANDN